LFLSHPCARIAEHDGCPPPNAPPDRRRTDCRHDIAAPDSKMGEARVLHAATVHEILGRLDTISRHDPVARCALLVLIHAIALGAVGAAELDLMMSDPRPPELWDWARLRHWSLGRLAA